MAISAETLRREFAKAGASIAAQCAYELARNGLLSDEGSQAIEEELARVANLCRAAGADVAETVFSNAATRIRDLRRG